MEYGCIVEPDEIIRLRMELGSIGQAEFGRHFAGPDDHMLRGSQGATAILVPFDIVRMDCGPRVGNAYSDTFLRATGRKKGTDFSLDDFRLKAAGNKFS